MNTDIIKQISDDLNITQKQVEVTLGLLEEGNTIPFIARYRKDATGALDEEQIKKIKLMTFLKLAENMSIQPPDEYLMNMQCSAV